MKFKEFWPRYLRAHSLPGTRSLHYFASVIGLMSVVEAIVTRQPFLVVGIGLGYAIAIVAHRFIERNKPMIRVSAFWGMVADMRMCWLAATGGLRREIDRSVCLGLPADRTHSRGNSKRMRMTPVIRVLLLCVCVLGLGAGLLDLDDLYEEGIGLHFPLLQLGVPIVAFSGALLLGVAAMAKSLSALSSSAQAPMSPAEESLWRASAVLVAFGGLALALAELAEHGYSQSGAAMAFGALTGFVATTPVLLIGGTTVPAPSRSWQPGLGIVVAKRVGAFGCAFGLMSAVGILIVQTACWAMAGWRPLPIGAVLARFTVSNKSQLEGGMGVAWILDLPASLVALAVAVIFLVVALRAAALERQGNEAWLFKTYLDQARGSTAGRPRSNR
jgi:hypothetical protein